MKLTAILHGLEVLKNIGSLEVGINAITLDSRKVKKGALFVALRGTQVDGHAFVDKAIENGATAVVVETWPETLQKEITYLQVADSAKALGRIASNFYGNPSEHLKLVGVTGTNGKTTTVSLLYELFMDLGFKTGMLSTIENKVGTKVLSATHTTPDAIAINAVLAEMVEAGCDYAFMEVSSHAVAQQRIAGLHFRGGVFTNISHDHLDYHKTFKAYIEAKKGFFDALPKTAFALVNLDDKRGRVMVQNTNAKPFFYSMHQMASFRARILDNSMTGLHMEIDGQEFFGQLIGAFNAYNLLAVYATAVLLEQDQVEVLTSLSKLKAAEGRFDYVFDPKRSIIGVVDYAHTPDALEKVLSTIRQLKAGGTQVVTVVGCGGDRDREKRPEMAKIACSMSEVVVLTSDNPRTEEPLAIIKDMEKGIPAGAASKVLVISDRKQAIKTACKVARNGDIILVAGKGHEKYQEINGVKHPFDDKKVLKAELLE